MGVHYYRNESAAKDTLEAVRRRSDGFVVQANVCRPEEITAMFRAARTKFGKLDIFVSNARPEAAEFFQPPMDITLTAVVCRSRFHRKSSLGNPRIPNQAPAG